MLPPKYIDEALRPHATETQWQYYELFTKLGSSRAVARHLDKSRSTVQETLAKLMDTALAAGYEPSEIITQPDLKTVGVSTYSDGDGTIKGQWDIQRMAGLDPDDTDAGDVDPAVVSRVATYRAGDGRIIGEWKVIKRDEQARLELLERWAERMSQSIVPRPMIVPILAPRREDLLAVYPVGDHHTGMLAWALETGQVDGNYDLKIARESLLRAVRTLVDQAPPCDNCLIPFLGDFFHVDSYRNVTPQSGHLLDQDVRFPKMFDLAFDMIEEVIMMALERHQNVTVIFEKGNHDPSVAAVVTKFLSRLFRDNPRVHIDDSPAWWHYYKFGKVMLITNHGDKVKPEKQLGVVAADQPVMWGDTVYRMVMNGHVHHEARREYPGGFVESFGVLPPLDAYAAIGGWRSMSQMHCLIFHREGWLAQRNYVTPAMFQ